MNNKLDTLLKSELLSVPDHFTARVMSEIYQLPMPESQQRWKKQLQFLAIMGSAILGVTEIFSFIFGMWTVTTAY